MEHQAVEIIIPLGAFALAFGVVYLAITSHNRKELAMIEAEMNPNKPKVRHSKIRTGLLLTFVPFGIFLGNILGPYTVLMNEELAIIFAFLFGGLALIVTYIVEKVFEKKRIELLD